MNRNYLAGALVILVLAVGGVLLAARQPASPASSKLKVAASFYPLYFFASQVGGDKADISNITPAGGEPHDYEPTAEDTANIENSRLLILNGGELEAWGDKIKSNIDPAKTTLLTAGEGLTTQTVTEGGNTVTDPHVWLSPVLAQQMVDKIEKGFEQADPANAAYYAANAQAFKAKLADLDTQYKQGLSMCAKKDIITSHAAFGYIATAYHLNQIAIAGLSPDAEPSAKQLADIANFAKKNNVKVIFFESLVSPKLSQTIAREVGAQSVVLDPIEGLANDDIAAGKSYMTQMEANLANLKTALQCQ